MKHVIRVSLVLVVAAVFALPARAVPATGLTEDLEALWTTVLQAPATENPFTGGDPCLDIGHRTVAPFAGGEELSCTVAPGTRIFVAAWSSECSTVEAAPYHGDDESSLRACVRAVDAGLQTPTVTLDGDPVVLIEIETGLLDFTLPDGHIFDPGLPAGTTGQSVGHGWVALVHPLPPGTHTIRIENHGTYLGDPLDLVNTTTIEVVA